MGWPGRKERRKGSVPAAQASLVSAREARSISPAAQADEAISRVPDTPEQQMMAIRQ